MYRIVLLRHGQSQWNLENRFTGWRDIDLSPTGVEESQLAATLLQEQNLNLGQVYTSVLKRAIHTMEIVLEGLEQTDLPVKETWRLNERHYGSLQGLNKKEVEAQYGSDQVFIWRRSYKIPPPSLGSKDPTHPSRDPKYKEYAPSAESLYETQNRVLPFWKTDVLPKLKEKKDILIVAHGNSLRSIVKYLDNISDENISQLNIPTGKPLIYQFNEDLTVLSKEYLELP